jgi:hypothetical protein
MKYQPWVYHSFSLLMLFQKVTRTTGYYVRHGCVGREMRRYVTSVISPCRFPIMPPRRKDGLARHSLECKKAKIWGPPERAPDDQENSMWYNIQD